MQDRSDYVLVYLALPGGSYEADQIRVMKGMFLLTREGPLSVRSLYNFEPYDWGPFDRGVYRDLERLEAQGLIVADNAEASRVVYRLTPRGQERAAEVAMVMEPDETASLSEIKTLTTSLGFVPLLRSVYAKYPDQASRSRLR